MSLVNDYLKHGWSLVPIPPGRKGPVLTGWNRRGATLLSAGDLTHGYGIGLAHAYSGTMALDIDQWRETEAYGIDLNALFAADDAVVIDSGRSDHGKLLYRMPFGLVLPSVQFSDTKKKAVFNFRCGTKEGKTVQDVLPPTIHPDTHKPYEWSGKGHWSKLPLIPDSLMTIWFKLLKLETVTIEVDGVDASWDEIQEALNFISPDCSRNEWIEVGMALQWAGSKTYRINEAFVIWDTWSSPSHKYPGKSEIITQWRSFKTNHQNPVTLGTLFHLAKQSGWVRPIPDASTLFSDIDVIPPEQLLNGLRPIPPDLDLEPWPEILRIRAKEVSDSVGCDHIVPLFAGLSAVCGVIDARTRLELMPGFKVPPVLWLMTIGDPADKKSPGSRPMLEHLKDIELADRPRYQKEVLDWEAKEIVYSIAKKAFLEFVSSPDALLGGIPPTIPELPPQPVPLKITVSDITSQKLVRQAADRPRGLLCHLDEMNGWVKKLTDKMSGEDRSAWVVSYESERYEMDRVGAGSVHCDNLAVSIYGNIQPRVFREHFEALGTDGLLQRFIPAVLRHEKTRLGHPIPDFFGHKQEWENTLQLIFRLPPIIYQLSEDAFKLYREFQQWYESEKYDERLLGVSDTFLTAFGKLEGLTGRLVLLFHVIEAPFNLKIEASVVERVISVIRGYVIPAYRYALSEVGGADTFETWLTEYVIQHADEQKLRLLDIRRASKFKLPNITNQSAWQIIMVAMDVLERSSWVIRSDDRRAEHRGQAEWLINPKLKDMFKQYRKEVIRVKQKNRETWWKGTKELPTSPVAPKVHGSDD